jgi:uncharacterized protein YvpB
MKRNLLTFFLLCAFCARNSSRQAPSGQGKISILEDTWLKTSLDQANQLDESQLCELKKGSVFVVNSIVADDSSNHFLVTLNESPKNCQFKKGYVYGVHISFSGQVTSGSQTSSLSGSSNANTLTMPYYYYQWHNQAAPPGASCGITSAAMLLGFLLKKEITPDQIFRHYGTHTKGQSPEGLAAIYKDFGVKSSGSSRFGSFEAIKKHIDNQEPVVVHGYFTAGHIILIVGYNQEGFVVYDPAGDWTRTVYGGYPNAPNDSTAGKGAVYTYDQMKAAIVERDNSLWMSWASMTR